MTWWCALMCVPVGCTVVANNRLSDKPLEGAQGAAGGAGATGGATVASGGDMPGGGGADGGQGGQAPKDPLGTPCSDNDACESGICSDGVCCDQACEHECLACGLLDLAGTCTPLAGQNPNNVCGSMAVCDSMGACVSIDGAACTIDANCTNDICSDGFCCNEECDGACESCAEVDTGFANGICAPALNEDMNECGGMGCIAQDQCCGDGQPAPGGACPTGVCTGGCNGNECIIECDEEDECNPSTITCPTGFDCTVRCTERHACRNVTLNCPFNHRCDIECNSPSGREHACETMTIVCTNGPCALLCTGESPCKDTIVECGTNACTATCVNSGSEDPELTETDDACTSNNDC